MKSNNNNTTTVVGKSIFGQNQVLGDPTEGAGGDPERTLSGTLRFGTLPPSMGITLPTTKLTFGLLRLFENVSSNPASERMETHLDLGLGHENNEFYLP